MRMVACFGLLFATGAVAWAQLDYTTITVSASRTTTVAPDQIVFAVTLTTPLSVGIDQAVAAVSSLGFTAADLNGTGLAYDDSRSPQGVQWNFTLAVPFAKMKSTVTAVSSLQGAIAQKRNGQSLTFSVVGSRVSPEAQATRPCSMADLVSDARTRAQSLASAAGVSVGPILEVTPATSGSATGYAIPAVLTLTGVLDNPLLADRTVPSATCGIVVKFRLLS